MPLFLMSEWKLARHDTVGALRALKDAEAIVRRSQLDYSKTIASVRALIVNRQFQALP